MHENNAAPGSPDPGRISTPRDFGAELTLAKERNGLTVRQLANAAVVPRGTVQDYLTGGHLPQPTNLDPLKRVLAACGEGSAERVEEWIRALHRARRAPGRRTAVDMPPYRGLSSFGQEDASWFHGREELTALITRRVERLAAAAGGSLIVVGPSGAGKSSLLRAGVIPALLGLGFKPVLLTPGTDPLRAIDAALPSGSGNALGTVLVVDQFEEIFADDLLDVDRQKFIDRLCRRRTAGHGLGPQAPDTASASPTVVLGMRADFYAHALRHPLLAETLQRNQIVVGPMTADELRRVITEPARQAHLDVEDGLVELALRDLAPRVTGVAAHDVGALPLLSHALRAVWDRHRGGKLTLADYVAVGGIAGSISKSADAVYADLTEPQREIARRLFGRLVRVGEDSPDTRRRAPLAEILGGRSETETEDIEEVLDRFVRARLLTVEKDAIEISHEALLTVWRQLVEWIGADREWLRRHRSLGAAAELWRSAGRDPDLLYRGGTLQVLRQAVDEGARLPALNSAEHEFYDASIKRESDEGVRERRRVRGRYLFGAIFAVLAVIAVSTGLYARQQYTDSQRESMQSLARLVASESDELRPGDVPLSMQLALAAYRISPTTESLSSLLNSTSVTPVTRFWSGANPDAESIAVHSDIVAIGTDSGSVQLMVVPTSGRIRPISSVLSTGTSKILSIQFSDSGRLLAAGSEDGKVYLWDTTDPSHARAEGSFAGPGGPVTAVAVNTDATEVAAGGADGPVRLWKDSGSGRFGLVADLTGIAGQVNGAAFSPDGQILVAGGADDTAHLWRVTGPAPVPLSTVNAPSGTKIFTVAISPNGQTLAAGTAETHAVMLWNIEDPVHPVQLPPLTGPGSWVNAVAFSPNGQTLAAASSDGKLWLYDLSTGQSIAQLPHPQPVTGVAFLADGSPVSVTVDDGVVRRWSLPGPIISGAQDGVFAVVFDQSGTRLGVFPGANDDTVTLWNTANMYDPVELGSPLPGGSGKGRYSGSGVLTPDGNTIIAGDADGTIQVWNVRDPSNPNKLQTLHAANALIESVNISPRGDLLATAADDGTVHLYRISASGTLTSLATITTPGAAAIYDVAFDSSNQHLVAASDDHEAYLYDIRQPQHPKFDARLGGFTSSAYSAAFNSTGSLLAVGSADSSVRVWNVTEPHDPTLVGGPLGGPVGYIYSLAFSPTSNILVASGNETGDIWMWDLTNPKQPTHMATLSGPATGAFSLGFNATGTVLVAGGLDHTVQLWNMNAATAANWICSVAGEPITPQEWARYVPGKTYAPPCT